MDNSDSLKPPDSGRVDSVDIIRGLTIMLMIFVNDISGVANLPEWMKHVGPRTDGMTFVDIVFPAFLFIIGMSMPFAIGKKLDTGTGLWPMWKHILTRTFGLIVIGLYMVNSYEIGEPLWLHKNVWGLLMYISVIIIWSRPLQKMSKSGLWRILKIAAVLILIGLAFLYRRPDYEGFFHMKTSWWGILGLIGWAYLSACFIYIPLRKNQFLLLGGMVMVYCIHMADQAGFFGRLPFFSLSLTMGSHAAVILGGVVLGNMLRFTESSEHKERLRQAFFFSIGLFFCGHLLHSLNQVHRMFIISKIFATVPWCLISSAWTIWIWMIIYWLVDVKGWHKWAHLFKQAGKNPLFAYVLEPVNQHVLALIALLFGGFNFYIWIGNSLTAGLLRGAAMAVFVTWLAGLFSKKYFQLKL